jgi:hypothetical protein
MLLLSSRISHGQSARSKDEPDFGAPPPMHVVRRADYNLSTRIGRRLPADTRLGAYDGKALSRGRFSNGICARRADTRLPGLRAIVRLLRGRAGLLRGTRLSSTGPMSRLPGSPPRRSQRRRHQGPGIGLRVCLAGRTWELRRRRRERERTVPPPHPVRRSPLRLPGRLYRLRARHRGPLRPPPWSARVLPRVLRRPAGAVAFLPHFRRPTRATSGRTRAEATCLGPRFRRSVRHR